MNEEIRFLRITDCEQLPTFTRVKAPSRLEAIEEFATACGLRILCIHTELVSFLHGGQRVNYSVSGEDPLIRLLWA